MKIIGLAAMAVSGMVTVGLLSLTAAAASTEDVVKRDEETAALVLATDEDDDTTGTDTTGTTGAANTGVTKTGVTDTRGDTTGHGRAGEKAGGTYDAAPHQGKQWAEQKATQPRAQAPAKARDVSYDTTDVGYDDSGDTSGGDSDSWS